MHMYVKAGMSEQGNDTENRSSKPRHFTDHNLGILWHKKKGGAVSVKSSKLMHVVHTAACKSFINNSLLAA